MPNVVIFGIECYARRISLVLDDRNGRRQPNVSAGSNNAGQPKCFARNYQQIPRNSYELATWLVGVCRESRTWDSLVRSLYRPIKKKVAKTRGKWRALGTPPRNHQIACLTSRVCVHSASFPCLLLSIALERCTRTVI